MGQRIPRADRLCMLAFPQGRGKKVEGGLCHRRKVELSSSAPTSSEWNIARGHGGARRPGRRLTACACCTKSQYEVRRTIWQVWGGATGSMTVGREGRLSFRSTKASSGSGRRGGTSSPGAKNANPNPPLRAASRRSAATASAPARVANAQAALESTIALGQGALARI